MSLGTSLRVDNVSLQGQTVRRRCETNPDSHGCSNQRGRCEEEVPFHGGKPLGPMEWTKAREVLVWAFRGVRVGEASNPGPASKRRRCQRLRALQRSMRNDSVDDMLLVSTGPEGFVICGW